MLTKHEFTNRITKLIQLTQNLPNIREKFQHDIDLLTENNIDDYNELLNAIISDALSDEIRATACWLLSKIGDKDGLPKLLYAVDDTFPRVRRQAIQALGELKFDDSQVLEKIHQALLNDEVIEVRKASAYSLGLLVHRDSLTPLVNTSDNKNEDPGVRGMAIESLIGFRERSTIPLLIHLLSDEASEVRFWSAFTLGQLGAQEALPELRRLVEEDHAEVAGWHSVSQEAADSIKIINDALPFMPLNDEADQV